MNWRDRAACQGVDPEMFFPIGDSRHAVRQRAAARAVCDGCLVRTACLAFAERVGIADGVWGGLDEADRRHRQVIRSRWSSVAASDSRTVRISKRGR